MFIDLDGLLAVRIFLDAQREKNYKREKKKKDC